MSVLLITPEKCTNCRSCEMVCSLGHEGAIDPIRSRVAVLDWDEKKRTVPTMCLQCEDAGCMAACPVKAITVDPVTNARIVNEFACIKCQMCIHMCAFGANHFDPIGRKILKCDLCNGDPLCAKVCPTGAIVAGEANTVNAAKRKQTAAKMKAIVRGARS